MTTKEIYEKQRKEIVSKIKKQIIKEKLIDPFKMLANGYFTWDIHEIIEGIRNIIQIPRTLYALIKIQIKNNNFGDILLYKTTLELLENLSEDKDLEDVQKEHIKRVKTIGRVIRNIFENSFAKNDPYLVAILLLKFGLVLGTLESTKDITLKALELTKNLQ